MLPHRGGRDVRKRRPDSRRSAVIRRNGSREIGLLGPRIQAANRSPSEQPHENGVAVIGHGEGSAAQLEGPQERSRMELEQTAPLELDVHHREQRFADLGHGGRHHQLPWTTPPPAGHRQQAAVGLVPENLAGHPVRNEQRPVPCDGRRGRQANDDGVTLLQPHRVDQAKTRRSRGRLLVFRVGSTGAHGAGRQRQDAKRRARAARGGSEKVCTEAITTSRERYGGIGVLVCDTAPIPCSRGSRLATGPGRSA